MEQAGSSNQARRSEQQPASRDQRGRREGSNLGGGMQQKSRDGNYIRIRGRSDPIRGKIFRFGFEKEKSPNPLKLIRVQVGFGGKVKSDPTFNPIRLIFKYLKFKIIIFHNPCLPQSHSLTLTHLPSSRPNSVQSSNISIYFCISHFLNFLFHFQKSNPDATSTLPGRPPSAFPNSLEVPSPGSQSPRFPTQLIPPDSLRSSPGQLAA